MFPNNTPLTVPMMNVINAEICFNEMPTNPDSGGLSCPFFIIRHDVQLGQRDGF